MFGIRASKIREATIRASTYVTTFVLSVVCLYVLILALIMIFQNHLIYMPRRRISQTPGSVGLAYRDVRFRAADGMELSGWFVPAATTGNTDPERVVLFCHGNAGNMSHRLDSIRVFHRLGLSVFLFDYRGYGESEGSPTEEGMYLDVEAAWRFLTQGKKTEMEKSFPPEKIILFGRSIGGSVATWLARSHTPDRLILEATFKSAPAMAAKYLPFVPFRLILRYRYDTLEYVRNISCPLLIIHSRKDEIVPFSHGRALYDAAKEPKTFLEISGSHNSGFLTSIDVYEKGLRSFVGTPTTRLYLLPRFSRGAGPL